MWLFVLKEILGLHILTVSHSIRRPILLKMSADSFPLDAVRKCFPSLASDYMFVENAGGSQVLGSVAETVKDYLLNSNVQMGESSRAPLSFQKTRSDMNHASSCCSRLRLSLQSLHAHRTRPRSSRALRRRREPRRSDEWRLGYTACRDTFANDRGDIAQAAEGRI